MIFSTPGITIFVFAFFAAVLGYIFTKRNFSMYLISLCAGVSGVGILVGTNFLFSGYALVVAYCLVLVSTFFVATYLGLPARVIGLLSASYLLPLCGSFGSFFSFRWSEGILHGDALAIIIVLMSLSGTFFWLRFKTDVNIYRWAPPIASIFGVVSFIYFYGVVAVITHSIFLKADALVMMYLSWGLLSLTLIFYALRQNLSFRVVLASVSSLLLPLSVSYPSFISLVWESGIKHQDSFGLAGMTTIIFLTILLLTQQFCREHDSRFSKLVGWCVVVGVSYLSGFLWVLCHSLLSSESLANVVFFVSYVIIIYSLVSLFTLLRVNLKWISFALATLIAPLFILVYSLVLPAKSLIWSPLEVVGLLVIIALIALVRAGLQRRYFPENDKEVVLLKAWNKILIILMFSYAGILLWVLSSTWFTTAIYST